MNEPGSLDMKRVDPAPPTWMFITLVAAGIYNLIWGTVAILFPNLLFRAVAMELPRYPELWQCIGMIVGVYGVGYLIAARNPLRHWPIVLVGFLGKVFGPIGFVFSILKGTLPPAFGLTIITNDLIWWVPFACILWRAFSAYAESQIAPLEEGSDQDPLSTVVGDSGKTLVEMSQSGPVLVVLLRHAGCVFHREALSDLAEAKQELNANDVQLAIVHMASGPNPADHSCGDRLDGAVHFSDPSCALYRAFGLERGTLGQLLGPVVWWRGFLAFLRGHGVGCMVGDGFQMPGVFLLQDGQVKKAYRHKTAADRPDYLQVALTDSHGPPARSTEPETISPASN